jgi:hypothetical protein
MTPDTPDLAPEAIEHLTRLAFFPAEGESFQVGTRTLTRQYVAIATEQAVTRAILDLVQQFPGQTLAEVFTHAQTELVELAALILADYDGTPVEAAHAWLCDRASKVTTSQLLVLVGGQLELHDQVTLLGKLLIASGLLERLASAFHLPPTSSASA